MTAETKGPARFKRSHPAALLGPMIRAAVIALAAGSASTYVFAQGQPAQGGDQPGAQPNEPRPGQPITVPPPAGDPNAARDAAERLRQRNEALRRQREEQQRRAMEGQQPGLEPGQPGFQPNPGQPGIPGQPGQPGVPGEPAGPLVVDDQPIPVGAEDHLEGEGTIRISFGNEPVELTAFVDYVSLVLGINIVPDPSMQQQQILFRAPIEIPKDQLLVLLAAIVEDKGFALIEDPNLGYFIKLAAQVPLSLEAQRFATTRIIRTPMAKPSAIVPPLTQALGQSAQALRTTPIDELGVLIVTGSPRVVASVERFVERILDELAAQTLHMFPMENVEATYGRSRVLVLNGKLAGSGGGGAAPIAPGAVASGGGGSLANLESRLFEHIGNTLIFRGTEDEAQQVSQLIDLVDIVTPLISRRYSAGSLAQDVASAGEREGLGPSNQTTGGGGAGGASLGFGGAGRPGAQGGIGAGGGGDAQPNTSGFTVDAESGSIIYYGTESQHKRVAELVKSFTEQLVGSRIDIQTYKLHNADAEGVADILLQLLEDDSETAGTSPFLPGSRQQGQRAQRARQPAALQPDGTVADAGADAGAGGDADASGAGAALAPDAEISIVADVDRNQIIVKAPARQQTIIEQIIKRLDQRQPQVYIEAQIVSVTTSDDFNWTVETQINAGQFLLFSNFGLSGAGTAPAGGQAAQGVRTVPTGNRGLTSAVIKSDFLPYVINTLQSETNARIESTPRILVNDNQTGTISSNREEPFATTTQGTATTTTGQGGVASAGTDLSVTPRISEGGYISLEYSIELSNFVGNPSSGLQPPRQTENYDSQVTVPSDSTIVVGGFTLSSSSESESGIPLLKDIPIIGNLFKGYGTSKRRTTIFVFITPTIMTDPNFIDLRLASEGPMRELNVRAVTPDLQPALIPTSPDDPLGSRLLPANEAPAQSYHQP